MGRWQRDEDLLPVDVVAECRCVLGHSRQITVGRDKDLVHKSERWLGQGSLIMHVRQALTARLGADRGSVGIYFAKQRMTSESAMCVLVTKYGRRAVEDAAGLHRNTVASVVARLQLEVPRSGFEVPCDAETLACGLGIVRTRERITGDEIAHDLGISTATLSRIEQGRGRGEEAVAMAEAERVLDALSRRLRVTNKKLKIRALLAGAAARDLLRWEAK